MNVQTAYTTYAIPPNLQRHMLRVAGVAEVLCEHWTGEKLDTGAIVLCCLFHDAAKLINFDLSKTEFFEEEADRIDFWRKTRQQMIEKYGDNEHAATLKMCREIDLSKKALALIDALEWSNIPDILRSNNYASGMSVYADMRVGPFGVISLFERINELKMRAGTTDTKTRIQNGIDLENLLQKNVNIEVKTIGDSQVNEKINALRKKEIQSS